MVPQILITFLIWGSGSPQDIVGIGAKPLGFLYIQYIQYFLVQYLRYTL